MSCPHCCDKLDLLRVSVDKWLEGDQLLLASKRAIEENPENAPMFLPGALAHPEPISPFRLALLTGKKWQNGKTLRVAFLDGSQTVQDKTLKMAQTWSNYANLKFVASTDANAEIRVSYKQQGSWSYIGTDVLGIPQGQPTINFGWINDQSADGDYSVVLHEFGHTLGCIHEHQNPTTSIQWNKPAVYAYYARMGWNQQMVDQNLFQKYSTNITQFTQMDAKSIMMYPIPKELTLDGFSVPMNTVLSDVDKSFATQMYPGSVVPPVGTVVLDTTVNIPAGKYRVIVKPA